jgi:hypothetical protein
MIEKMKKVYVVSTVSRKQEMLAGLRDFGMLHLAERKSGDRSISDRFQSLSKTAMTLKDYIGKDQKEAPLLSDDEFEKVYQDVLATIDKKTTLIQERGAAASEAERVLPWGDFSPAQLKELQGFGFDFHFYRIGEKELQDALADESVKIIRKQLETLTGKKCDLEIKEIKNPDLDAYLVGMNIAGQIERRVGYRRAMKRAIQQAMRQGAQGTKIQIGGRIGGADIARVVWLREGRVPLQTLRADIDFAARKLRQLTVRSVSKFGSIAESSFPCF